MKVAYIRISSSSKSYEDHCDAFQEENVERIFEQKSSGATTKGRIKLKEMLEFVRDGDELFITRVDRLARSVLDLQLIVQELTDKVLNHTATAQPISTKDATSRYFLDMLSVFQSFETNIQRERQLEEIAKSKAMGLYKVGKKVVDFQKI